MTKRELYYRLFGADGALRRVAPGRRALDVGCSDGRGSEVLTGAFGCDIYRPALDAARRTGRRAPVTQADLRCLPFRSRAFDLVTALDVVEHFEKGDALTVLSEMARVSCDLVIVMTPNGFVPQPATEEEPWQLHRCGFSVDELRGLGYDVVGVGGWRSLRGDYASFRMGPVGMLFTLATSPWTHRSPAAAFHLLGIKRVRD